MFKSVNIDQLPKTITFDGSSKTITLERLNALSPDLRLSADMSTWTFETTSKMLRAAADQKKWHIAFYLILIRLKGADYGPDRLSITVALSQVYQFSASNNKMDTYFDLKRSVSDFVLQGLELHDLLEKAAKAGDVSVVADLCMVKGSDAVGSLAVQAALDSAGEYQQWDVFHYIIIFHRDKLNFETMKRAISNLAKFGDCNDALKVFQHECRYLHDNAGNSSELIADLASQVLVLAVQHSQGTLDDVQEICHVQSFRSNISVFRGAISEARKLAEEKSPANSDLVEYFDKMLQETAKKDTKHSRQWGLFRRAASIPKGDRKDVSSIACSV